MLTTRLTVLSELSKGLPYIHLGHLAHRQRCSIKIISYTAAGAGRRSDERERGTPPSVLDLLRTSKCRNHPCNHHCPSCSSTVGLRRDGGMSGVLSDHELDILSNESYQYYYSLWSTWTLSSRQGTQAPHLHVLWDLSFIPSYVSHYPTWNT